MTIGPAAKAAQVDPELIARLTAWIADPCVRDDLSIDVGYRSLAAQQVAYDLYLAGRGPTAAKPGQSKHNLSPAQAVDLRGASGLPGSGHATLSERQIGARYGLTWPVGRQTAGGGPYDTTEPWHVECLPGWTAPVAISVVTKTPGATRWLPISGVLDAETVARWQSVLGLESTGKLDATLIKAVQRILKARDRHGYDWQDLEVDGVDLGSNAVSRYPKTGKTHTVWALQGDLGVKPDGHLSYPVSGTVKALQSRLNTGRF